MTTYVRSLVPAAALALLMSWSVASLAQQEPPTPPAPEAPELERETPSEDATRDLERAEAQLESAERELQLREEDIERRIEEEVERHLAGRGDDVIFNIGDDSFLPKDARASGVVAIFGNSTVEGEVGDVVMAIFGNTRMTGRAGEAAVSIFGDTYVDGEVGDVVVSILGNVELGPNAVVRGDVGVVGGKLTRAEGAQVRGNVQQVGIGDKLGFDWAKAWFQECLLYGRPLAFDKDVMWAWWLAFGFLGLYVIISLLFGGAVEKCVATLEERPGQSALASLLTVVFTPVVMMLLFITIIGIAVLPFLAMGMFVAGLFGKAVILAAIGKRITKFTGVGPFSHVAVATLVGGVLILFLYVVPFLGFIAYKLLGLLGLGVVVYTILLAVRAHRSNGSSPAPAMAMAGGPSASMAGVSMAGDSMSASSSTGSNGPAYTNEAGPGFSGGQPVPPASSAAASTASDVASLPRAGFWIRMVALLIDVVLVALVLQLIDTDGDLIVVGLAFYGAVMWKLRGSTVGGIVCNLQVVRLDGRELSWDTAVVRALGCFLSLVVAFLGFIWIAFDPDRQSWHDKIAGTVVVQGKARPLV
jgi:uncharacterized RDD family membrane protein YckC